MADVANLDLFRGITHGTGGVLKQRLLLFGTHHPKQSTRLRVVVVIILTMVPMIGSAFKAERRFAEVGLLLPLAIAVWLVAERAAVVVVHSHGTVSVVAVDGTASAVHRESSCD